MGVSQYRSFVLDIISIYIYTSLILRLGHPIVHVVDLEFLHPDWLVAISDIAVIAMISIIALYRYVFLPVMTWLSFDDYLYIDHVYVGPRYLVALCPCALLPLVAFIVILLLYWFSLVW